MELENNLTKDQQLEEEAERVRGELNEMLSSTPSIIFKTIKYVLLGIAITVILLAVYIWHPW